MATLLVHSFKTSFGTIQTAAMADGLSLIALPNMSSEKFRALVRKYYPDLQTGKGGEINLAAEEQICAFLEGKLKRFFLKLNLYGTPFQKAVLDQVAAIPYGTVRSYGEIARAVGRPGASRAVGTVNARNRLPLVIPCHRVVAASGLGGYGGGLEMKTQLLIMEGALPDQLTVASGKVRTYS
jgi:methylated-DNA-[protein]-cysteine S-methyltransferase